MKHSPQSRLTVDITDTSIGFRAKTDSELNNAYRLFKAVGHPRLVGLGSKIAKLALKLHLPIEPLLKNTFFKQFCGGQSIEQCKATVSQLAHYGIGTILDYAIEGLGTDKGFDATASEIIKTIELAHRTPSIPFGVVKMTGIARLDLMAKVSSGVGLTDVEHSEWSRVEARLELLCSKAHQLRVRFFIDAEETWAQDAIDKLVYEMMAKYNTQSAYIYNTLQMYRHDRLQHLEAAHEAAKSKRYFLGLKLVRGAYIEKEREHAAQLGLGSPVFADKAATDKAYDDAVRYCIEHVDRISVCVATHNETSTINACKLLEEHNIERDDTRVYFSQLYGMGDHISYNLAAAGYKIAKYVPYGPIRSVFPYLVRRAEENTSILGQSSRELVLISAEIARRKSL